MVQKFCEQNAMGSPLPTKSGRRQFLYGIRSASRKRFCWFRYLDDTFVVCSHGEVVMASFLTHLKNLHLRIQFTIHRKRKKIQLTSLNVLVTRNTNGALGYSIYRTWSTPTGTCKRLESSKSQTSCHEDTCTSRSLQTPSTTSRASISEVSPPIK